MCYKENDVILVLIIFLINFRLNKLIIKVFRRLYLKLIRAKI